MNNQILLLRNYYENSFVTQRQLAGEMEVSVGTVNSLIASSEKDGLITRVELNSKPGFKVTEKGMDILEEYRVDRAVIFSAGFGSRLVPLTWDTPKGLLNVFGECMIERLIKQLHDVDITDITVMVGYMKERFEYLKDKYGVKLIYNPEYDCKNTLSTLHCAKDIFMGHNCYLLYSDNWLRKNMFHKYEPNAWYASVFKEGKTSEWLFEFNKKNQITNIIEGGANDWIMFGPVYFSREYSAKFIPVCEQYYNSPATEQDYLETVMLDWIHGSNRIIPLKVKDCPKLYINKQPADQIHEFDSLEEMKELDDYYAHSSINEALRIISETFNVPVTVIKNIKDMKVGLTNHSFMFTIHEKPYICRVPWDLCSEFMNRRNEAETLKAIEPLGISEKVLYFDPEKGYKIAEFYPNTHNPDINSDEDMKRCMNVIRKLHGAKLKVNHSFDLREQFDNFEKGCLKACSIDLKGYAEVKKHTFELIDKLDSLGREKILCHVDPSVGNWLFFDDRDEIKLIDWEYSGMADPLIEAAEISNYSYLDKAGVDRITDLYFEDRKPTEQERGIVYAHLSVIGILWALWGVRAVHYGGKYEEYTSKQYQYAIDFYKEAIKRL